MHELPQVRTMTRRIIKTFSYATPDAIASGAEWYDRARAFAEELVTHWGTGVEATHEEAVEKAAGVIAVLSPRLSWPKNVELAERAYRSFYTTRSGWDVDVKEAVIAEWPGLKDGARKAFRLLEGERPDDVVSGPKVRQFWIAIVNPSDPRVLVVDRHALDIAVNEVLDDRIRGRLLGRKGAYDEVSKAYRDATRLINKLGLAGRQITPAQLQAITWEWWRKNRAAANHG